MALKMGKLGTYQGKTGSRTSTAPTYSDYALLDALNRRRKTQEQQLFDNMQKNPTLALTTSIGGLLGSIVGNKVFDNGVRKTTDSVRDMDVFKDMVKPVPDGVKFTEGLMEKYGDDANPVQLENDKERATDAIKQSERHLFDNMSPEQVRDVIRQRAMQEGRNSAQIDKIMANVNPEIDAAYTKYNEAQDALKYAAGVQYMQEGRIQDAMELLPQFKDTKYAQALGTMGDYLISERNYQDRRTDADRNYDLNMARYEANREDAAYNRDWNEKKFKAQQENEIARQKAAQANADRSYNLSVLGHNATQANADRTHALAMQRFALEREKAAAEQKAKNQQHILAPSELPYGVIPLIDLDPALIPYLNSPKINPQEKGYNAAGNLIHDKDRNVVYTNEEAGNKIRAYQSGLRDLRNTDTFNENLRHDISVLTSVFGGKGDAEKTLNDAALNRLLQYPPYADAIYSALQKGGVDVRNGEKLADAYKRIQQANAKPKRSREEILAEANKSGEETIKNVQGFFGELADNANKPVIIFNSRR